MKHLIVPVDFSDLSLKGVELALVMASQLRAEVTMVNVIPSEHNTLLGNVKHSHEKINNAFESIVERYSQNYSGVKLNYLIREGKVHDEIINHAETFENSIIVTSTHGASGWEELFVGSNTYKMVATTVRSIITTRERDVPKKIKKIVLPIDSTPETREKVPVTAIMAKHLGATVNIITLSHYKDKEFDKKLLNHASQVYDYFYKYGIKSEIEQLHGSNLTDITIEYAKNNGADLISIMTEQENSITNFLLGSHAHQMINKSPIPVMLFPTKQIGAITNYFQTFANDL